MKRKFIPALAIAISLFAAHSVQAQEETSGSSIFPRPRGLATGSELKPHIGLKMGFAAPEGSQSSAGKMGVDIGFQPAVPIGLGFELSTTDSSLERSYGLVKAKYNFGGDVVLIKNTYIGLGAGALFKTDGTDALLAPGIGFDIPLKRDGEVSRFSLGANAQYLASFSSDPDFLAVDAVVKFWY